VDSARSKSPAIVSGSDYLALPRSAETWLIEPLLPVGGTMLLYGDPKVGKSYAALQLAISLATGSDWFSFRGRGSRQVVYIQLDTPRSLWADRVQRLRDSGLATDAVFFADRETLDTWPFDILNIEHQILLSEALAKIKPDAVILDTLREAHRGDENDATDMQNVVSHLTAAVKPAALIMVAHGRKASAERETSLINDNRGSNYVVGAVDAIAHMTEKGLECGGRAIDETTINLERSANGTWTLTKNAEAKKLARELLAHDDSTPLREKARKVAGVTGMTEAASLSMLHRMNHARQ
jgi:RecA-family ATPase